jgi:hypothetical protein
MSDQAERIHAALLRFKGVQPRAGSRRVAQDVSSREIVVVDEKNLAALSPPNADLAGAKAGTCQVAAAKGEIAGSA